MTDAPNPSAAKTEAFEARALMLVQKHGNPVGTDYEQGQNDMGHRMVTMARDADAAILSARTHPQPSLSVGLDREAVARVIAAELCKQDYDPHADPATVFPDDTLSWSYIDQGHVDFGLIADAILALAAPAEGYVLVPVEAVQPFFDAMKVIRPDDHDTSKICLATVADYRRLAACLPAAPTGETEA